MSFVVIHNDAVLGKSFPVTIYPGFEEPSKIYNVDFAVKLSYTIEDRGSVDSLVSTPVLSKLHLCTVIYLNCVSRVDVFENLPLFTLKSNSLLLSLLKK